MKKDDPSRIRRGKKGGRNNHPLLRPGKRSKSFYRRWKEGRLKQKGKRKKGPVPFVKRGEKKKGREGEAFSRRERKLSVRESVSSGKKKRKAYSSNCARGKLLFFLMKRRGGQ